MFIQVVRGTVRDAGAATSMLDRWRYDVAPGAKGFLGSTSGVAEDGTLIAVVRFESPEAAKNNSNRAEQQVWWSDMSKLFDGEANVYDCPIVDDGVAGASPDAGFVQVTMCRVSDVPAARKFGAQFADIAPKVRPDLLGFTDAFTDDGRCITTSYFSSEEVAREGEKAEMPPEHQEVFGAFRDLVSEFEYFDLRDPTVFTAR